MYLVTNLYRFTKELHKEEKYNIGDQLKRCSVSIPCNIAEGYGRKLTNDSIRFLQITLGSLYELQTILEICLNLVYIKKPDFDNFHENAREIERMPTSLIRKIKDSR